MQQNPSLLQPQPNHHPRPDVSVVNGDLPAPSDNVSEELNRIISALQVVYSTSPNANNSTNNNNSNSETEWTRQLADRYLVRFQSSSVAWMVCDQLLATYKEPEILFFASQTLHNKCLQDVHQLPSSSLPSLRDSLINHCLQESLNASAVQTQLALAIGALAVQINWSSIVQDLSQQPNQEAVLKILQYLPEECSSTRLLLEDDTLRYMMEDALLSHANHVLTTYPSLWLWLAWIRYLPLQPATLIPLVPHCLAHLTSHEVAVDVLVEIIRLYPSHVPRHEDLVQTIVTQVMQMPHIAVIQQQEEDLQRAYCRIFTEMGESYLSLLLDNNNQNTTQEGAAQALLNNITHCTSIPDKTISTMTHNFWYRFVNELDSMDDYRKRQHYIDLYTPHLLHLLDVCLLHLEYDDEHEASGQDEALLDDFHRERFYLGESMEDCCRLLGPKAILERIGHRLTATTSNNNNTQQSWKSMEACLYALGPLARYVPHDEVEFMPQLFQLLLPQLTPDTIEPLRYTVCLLIGKYAPWLASHQDYLPTLLPYLAQSLITMPKCAMVAAEAIKHLCQRIPMAESVLTLYNNQVSGHVEIGVDLEILQGLCVTVQPGTEMDQYASQIVTPIGNRLSAVNNNDVPKHVVMNEVSRLTTVIRYLRMPPPLVVQVLQSSWPFLEIAGQRFASDAAEKLTRLHKHGLRICGTQAYGPTLLPNLMKLIVRDYERTHQAPYLYLASIVVTEYPHHEELYNMMSALCRTTFSFLTNMQELTNHPDVVEELFYCIGRMVKHRPEPLVSTRDLLSSLVQCALLGMELDHREANRGTFNFLQHLVSYGLEHGQSNTAAIVLETLHVHGQALVTNLIRALTGDLPAYCADSISGVLYELHQMHMPVNHWLAMSAAKDQLALRDNCDQQTFDMSVRSFRAVSERHQWRMNR